MAQHFMKDPIFIHDGVEGQPNGKRHDVDDDGHDNADGKFLILRKFVVGGVDGIIQAEDIVE